MALGSFDNYTPAGDLAVIALCAVMVILLMTSYVSRTRSLRIFLAIVCQLVLAALVSIGYNVLLANATAGNVALIYVLRIVYNALLFDLLFLFALYAVIASEMEHRKARAVAIVFTVLLVAFLGIDIVSTLMGGGFQIAGDGTVEHESNIYIVGYCLFVALLAVLLTRVRHLLYKRVMYGFFGTMAISVAIRLGQMVQNRSSLTTLSFALPTVAMMYIMHSTPYNVTLGAVDVQAMQDMVRHMYARKTSFLYMSLFLLDYNMEGAAFPEDIRAQVRRFAGESIEEISEKNEYASLIQSIERGMPDNTICRVGPDEIDRFNRDEYILRELTDIFNKRDLADPRVLVFCQPVFNLQTGLFDTAEALMRLKLEQTGIVNPEEFIALAEDHGYIHVLTEIILHKTCQAVRRLMEEGFHINRVSVNVSVLELKEDDFCGDIDRIIDDNRVPGEKIAIEITESHSEADFMIMKRKIEELRQQGIKFYLDDFGTGYSNMERIMELPFDIIKFDRSLVVASGTSKRSEKIVENLANMFKGMDYSVLYEGVETEGDEKRCREMSATYLQGYKYSRPVPIEELRNYLTKAG